MIEIAKNKNKYELIQHDENAKMRTDVVLLGGCWLWDKAPMFDSYAEAQAFVEQNKQYIL